MNSGMEELINAVSEFDGFDPSPLKTLAAKLEEEKKGASIGNNEDLANECWRHMAAIKLNLLFSEIFTKLKNQDYLAAWTELEQCEIVAKDLISNCESAFLRKMRIIYIQTSVKRWQSLFPYRAFFSPGFICGYYTCGICDHKIRPRSRCGHKKGYLYSGEICFHVAHEMEMLEISIVTNPVQKYSVVTGDFEYDYSLIDYVCARLESPYVEWTTDWKTKTYPRNKFSKVSVSDSCPCKSGDKFIDCCSAKAYVSIPHVEITFNAAIPKELETTVFPY